ncbi:MAG: glutamine amidotransferase [Xanthomonadales bacterium]|nr:glutamine amidotransferase [Xanthomonadales bacterium]
MKQIALIKTGCTIEQIKPRHGDFEDWFADGLGVSDLLQIDVFRQESLPAMENLSGIVITGSPAMVSARLDWSERTARWLRQAVQTNIKVLGVCYGHQLLAHALGGIAGPNPAGRQIGTVDLQLIDNVENDPLLGHLPKRFSAQASHAEAVLEMPPGAQRLATSPLDDNFAIRFAENAWGVQFHPEFSAPVVSDYIRYRTDALREEGLNPEQLMANVTETEEAASVLRKFVKLLRF